MPRKRPKGYIPRPPGRPAKYPWKEWFDGEQHFIQPQVDFDGTVESMRQQIYTRARQDDLIVNVTRYGAGLVIKAGQAKRSEGPRYDWDTLLNGETHSLTVGRDFDAQPESFRQYARRQAVARGGRLSSRLIGNTLMIRADIPRTHNPLDDLPFTIERPI